MLWAKFVNFIKSVTALQTLVFWRARHMCSLVGPAGIIVDGRAVLHSSTDETHEKLMQCQGGRYFSTVFIVKQFRTLTNWRILEATFTWLSKWRWVYKRAFDRIKAHDSAKWGQTRFNGRVADDAFQGRLGC